MRAKRYGSLEQGTPRRGRPRSLRELRELSDLRELRELAARLGKSPRLYLASLPTRPISQVYGFDRGKPADRRWIEQFLAGHADAISGHCLEVTSDEYVRHFGGDAVTEVDVLDIDPANAAATITADICHLDGVPAATFDCAVVTQTLQYVREPRLAIAELHRVLKPGGTLLVTVPCLGRVEPADVVDYWRFMPAGAAALFDAPDWEVRLERFGNVLLGLAMWTGMAVTDLPSRAWEADDPDWPCVVGIRATKAP